MLKLSARTTVAELMEGPPALYTTLKSTGIFKDGDDPQIMVGQLCWNFGFSPSMLLMMLENVNIPEFIPPVDLAPYLKMPLDELVDHLEHTHHAYLREILPQLLSDTQALAEEQADSTSLAEVHEEFRRMAIDLDGHIAHEEEALFPMARDLATRTTVRQTRCGDSVGGPIACMENEHQDTQRSLGKLRQLTNDYAVVEDTSPLWQKTMAALAQLDRDLQEHMYKENEALFPRALKAQLGGPQEKAEAAAAS